MMQAVAATAPGQAVLTPPVPRLAKSVGYPTVGYAVWYDSIAVSMVRTDAAADDSLAAIRARSRFGMAIAAMIRMIATTISNSISEKPFCLRISFSLISMPIVSGVLRLTSRRVAGKGPVSGVTPANTGNRR